MNPVESAATDSVQRVRMDIDQAVAIAVRVDAVEVQTAVAVVSGVDQAVATGRRIGIRAGPVIGRAVRRWTGR
jgi:hypothetical protein